MKQIEFNESDYLYSYADHMLTVHVHGPRISKEAAGDLILKTDIFFRGEGKFDTNDNQKLIQEFGMETMRRREKQYGQYSIAMLSEDYDLFCSEKGYGYVHLKFLKNNWIDRSCMHYGFCRPDGVIDTTFTVKDGLEVDRLVTDMRRLKKAFPNLELTVDVERQMKNETNEVLRFSNMPDEPKTMVFRLNDDEKKDVFPQEDICFDSIINWGKFFKANNYVLCVKTVVEPVTGDEMWTEGKTYRIVPNQKEKTALFNNQKIPMIVEHEFVQNFKFNE